MSTEQPVSPTSNRKMSLLEVGNLKVDISLAAGDLHAVRGVSFGVEKGKTLGLVGESGCGKSMSALAVMNLLPPRARRQAAHLRFADKDLSPMTEKEMIDIRGNRISMIFQEPTTSMNPSYTIGDQLTEALLCHRRGTRAQARDRAVFLLEKVGITAASRRLKQYPHQLSGGLRQRVMIAMALMCGPELVIADEPTTALDVTIQAQILLLLAQLQKEFRMAMILITHDLGVVSTVADQVAVLYAGQVVEQGTTEQIFLDPLHPYTQGLLACLPIPGKTPRGSHLGSIPGKVPSLIGNLTGCGFANRCPHVHETCTRGEIPLKEFEAGRAYRCVLSSDECRRNARKGLGR
jgi:peptide/nickel transport system ATP-binding protein